MDEFVRRDLIKNTLDHSYFIKAGAGAGKTRMVVDRVVEQLKHGYNPEEIVVITFTEKAAQELLERILSGLSEETKKDKSLADKLKNISRMQISTIHSFCNTLIKEQIFSAKLPMGIELLQDDNLELQLDAFFNSYFQKIDYDKLKRLRENYDYRLYRFHLKGAFKAIYNLPKSTVIVYRDDLLGNTDDYYQEKMTALAEEVITEGVRMLNVTQGLNCKAISKENEAFFKKESKDYCEKKEANDFLKVIAKEEGYALFNAKKAKEENEALMAFMEDKQKEAKALLDEYEAYRHALITDAALDLRNLYIEQREKNKRTFITNDDLLQVAQQLICTSKEAWEYYSEKYRCIYVDEFQDTDHVQSEMILRLCSKSFISNELVPGKLVVVGDAKQSIYRFRGADLPEYRRVEKTYKNQNNQAIEVENLAFNFRSSPLVVNWVNDNFAPVIENYEPMESKCRRLTGALPSTIDASKIIEGVYPITVADSPADKEVVEKDCRLLIGLIKNLVGKYYIYDKDFNNGEGQPKGNYRKVKYSDFLLLIKKTTDMGKYASALLEKSIPVSLAGKISVSTIREMNRFVRLFQYLAQGNPDRNDQEAIAQELLQSPLYEMDLPQAHMNELRNKTKGMSAVTLAIYLNHHLEYVLDRNKTISREKMVILQCRIQQMIEKTIAKFENNPQSMIAGFRNYLDGDVERELSLSSNADAVRFMNVHKSKGLEGKIVVVMNRRSDKKRPPQTYQVFENNHYNCYPCYPTDNFGVSSLCGFKGDDTITEAAENESKSELTRLEYVTATRAEEALIIFPSATTKNGESASFMGAYDYDFGDNANYTNGLTLQLGINEEEAEIKPIDYPINCFDRVVSEDQKKPTYEDKCPSSLENEKNDKTFSQSLNRPVGAEFGTVMHRCFELAAYEIAHHRQVEIQRVVHQAMLESDTALKEKYALELEKIDEIDSFLQQCLKRYIGSSLAQRIAQAERVITEMPFYYAEDNQAWVHGFVDLLMINPDGSLSIVDYKSDVKADNDSLEAFEKRLHDCYNPQLQLYKESVQRLFNNDRISFEIYHLYL